MFSNTTNKIQNLNYFVKDFSSTKCLKWVNRSWNVLKPVLGHLLVAEQFQFPCRVIIDTFCLNWMKLFFANPPNSQTLHQKSTLFSQFKKNLGWKFLWPCWLLCWRIHRGSYVCKVAVSKSQYKILENRDMARFFQHSRILPNLQLWLHLCGFKTRQGRPLLKQIFHPLSTWHQDWEGSDFFNRPGVAGAVL